MSGTAKYLLCRCGRLVEGKLYSREEDEWSVTTGTRSSSLRLCNFPLPAGASSRFILPYFAWKDYFAGQSSYKCIDELPQLLRREACSSRGTRSGEPILRKHRPSHRALESCAHSFISCVRVCIDRDVTCVSVPQHGVDESVFLAVYL